MALHKAIKSGKEHRIEYGTKGQPYTKAIDSHCRNHGCCVWCMNNRIFKYKSKDKITKKELQEFINEI